MDTITLALIIAGIASIGVAVLGKFRPDIIYKEREYRISISVLGNLSSHDRQRWGFAVYFLFGLMLLMMAAVLYVPQWQYCQVEMILSVVMLMTIVLLLLFWKIILSKYDRYKKNGLIVVLLLSACLIAFTLYFWYF